MLYFQFFLLNFVSIFVAAGTSSTDGADGNEHPVSSQQETNAGKHGEFLLRVCIFCKHMVKTHVYIDIDILKCLRREKLD